MTRFATLVRPAALAALAASVAAAMLAPVAAAPPEAPAGLAMEPAPPPTVADLTRAVLLREAAMLGLPEGVEVELSLDDGRIAEWRVNLGGPTVLDAVRRSVPDAPIDPRAVLDRWSAGLRTTLFDLTVRTIAGESRDPHFNPETDFRLHVGGRVLPTFERDDDSERARAATYYGVHFVGSQAAYRYDALTDTTLVLSPPKPAVLEANQVTVEILPRQAVWDYREAISGTITVRNTGTRRVPVSGFDLDHVEITGRDGKPPERFFMTGHVSFEGPGWSNKFLLPGESHTGEFLIRTDPLAAYQLHNGLLVGEGEWVLSYPSLEDRNVAVKSTPVRIEVRAAPGAYTGPRITHAEAAGSRLVLFREEGLVQVVEPATDEHLGAARPPGYDPDWTWLGARAVLSPDGRLMASCRDRQGPITVEALFGTAPPQRSITAPAGVEVGPGGFFPLRFSPDGRTLLCGTNGRIVAVDLHTGTEVRRAELPTEWPPMWAKLSPDGRFAVDAVGGVMRLAGSRGEDAYTLVMVPLGDPAAVRRVRIEGHGDWPTLVTGLEGVYLTDEFSEGVLYQPYDGGAARTFATGRVSVEAESADGTLVAFTSPGGPNVDDFTGATTVEVWDVRRGEKRYEVGGGRQQSPLFLADPPRLVCLTRTFLPDGAMNEVGYLLERARVYDARTGAPLGEVDLTPRPGELPAPAPAAENER